MKKIERERKEGKRKQKKKTKTKKERKRKKKKKRKERKERRKEERKKKNNKKERKKGLWRPPWIKCIKPANGHYNQNATYSIYFWLIKYFPTSNLNKCQVVGENTKCTAVMLQDYLSP